MEIYVPQIDGIHANAFLNSNVWYIDDTTPIDMIKAPRLGQHFTTIPCVLYHGRVNRIDSKTVRRALSSKATATVATMALHEALFRYSFLINTEGNVPTYGAYIDEKGYAKDYYWRDRSLVIHLDSSSRVTDMISVFSPIDAEGVKVIRYYNTVTGAYVAGAPQYQGIQVTRASSLGLRLVTYMLDDEGVIVTNNTLLVVDPLSGRPFNLTRLANGHHILGPPKVAFLVRYHENNITRSVPIGIGSCSPVQAVVNVIAKIAGVPARQLSGLILDGMTNAIKINDHFLAAATNNATAMLTFSIQFSVQRSEKVTCTYEILNLCVAVGL